MLVEGSPLNDREYSTDEGVVKDPLYEEVVEHGNEEYIPPKEPEEPEEVTADPATKSTPELRSSTYAVREAKGLYEENENEFEKGPSLTEGDVPDNADIDSSSLVAASHRQSSSVESKKQSAEKASKLHEEITGDPLEIGE
ncbi:17169_t:CDS:2, partial [Racocetra fulgida]